MTTIFDLAASIVWLDAAMTAQGIPPEIRRKVVDTVTLGLIADELDGHALVWKRAQARLSANPERLETAEEAAQEVLRSPRP